MTPKRGGGFRRPVDGAEELREGAGGGEPWGPQHLSACSASWWARRGSKGSSGS